jgi:stress response protein YsnF
MQEHVEVNRVVVNQIVDEIPPIRYEGDTMIVPILEEIVVIDVRLIVREEVHIVRHREELHEPQRVVLRREEVQIEAVDENLDDDSQS